MTNDETQLKDLENLSNEELELKVAEAEAEDDEGTDDSKSTDWEAKAKAAENRAAMLQRLLNKKDKTITKTNTNKSGPGDISKDIEEIRFLRKVDTFAEDNGLTKAQAQRVLSINPNATSETLKDPFFAEGLKAIARKEKVESATPGSGRVAVVNGKSFKELSRDERIANFGKFVEN